MSVALLYNRYRDGALGALVADMIVDETHQLSNAVTAFPVETGADMTDHIRAQPRTLSLTHYVNRTTAEQAGAVQSDRVGETWDQLKQLWAAGEPITVISTLDVYPNMAITSISTPRGADNVNHIIYSVQLQQIRFASSITVAIPPDQVAPAQRDAAAPVADRGQVQVTQASPAQTERAQQAAA